jgi:CheY-like chemotaxis protein
MNGSTKNSPALLIGEDDKDDRLLLQEAFNDNGFSNQLTFVRDGEELLNFLRKKEGFITASVLPDLIMLDLNLPKKDGREVLKEIKQDSSLRKIPVIIFSTSGSHYDISSCYELGANCYMIKPQTYKELVDAIGRIGNFWFELVEFSTKIEP